MKIFYRYGSMITDHGKKVEIIRNKYGNKAPSIKIGPYRAGEEETRMVLKVLLKNAWMKKIGDNRYLTIISGTPYIINTNGPWSIKSTSLDVIMFTMESDKYDEDENEEEMTLDL